MSKRATNDSEVAIALQVLQRAIKNVSVRRDYLQSCLPYADGLAYSQDKTKIEECGQVMWIYQQAFDQLRLAYPWVEYGEPNEV